MATFKTWQEWDCQLGMAEFEEAIELNPRYAEARILHSHLLSILGRIEEGTQEAERALELDPFNPFFQGFYGVQLLMAGRYDDAIKWFRETFENDPTEGFGHDVYWEALYQSGRKDEALAEAKVVFAGFPKVVEALDLGFVDSGYEGAMRLAAETLEELDRSGEAFIPPLELVTMYDLAGDIDKTWEWLERAYESRDPNMPYVDAIPLSKEVRSDPRYDGLLRQMNLPSAGKGPAAKSS